MSEAIYDGRRRCGDRKQTPEVAEGGQKGIDGGVVTSSLDLRKGGGTEGRRWEVRPVLIGDIDPELDHSGFQAC